MSPKLRRLSGKKVIVILKGFSFDVHSQRSHVKMRRVTPTGQKQTRTIVAHEELDLGTLYAIFRQASRYIPADELRPHFFTD